MKITKTYKNKTMFSHTSRPRSRIWGTSVRKHCFVFVFLLCSCSFCFSLVFICFSMVLGLFFCFCFFLCFSKVFIGFAMVLDSFCWFLLVFPGFSGHNLLQPHFKRKKQPPKSKFQDSGIQGQKV